MIDERTFGMIYGASFDQLSREDDFLNYFLSKRKKERILAVRKLKLLIARKISNQTKLWELWKTEGFEE